MMKMLSQSECLKCCWNGMTKMLSRNEWLKCCWKCIGNGPLGPGPPVGAHLGTGPWAMAPSWGPSWPPIIGFCRKLANVVAFFENCQNKKTRNAISSRMVPVSRRDLCSEIRSWKKRWRYFEGRGTTTRLCLGPMPPSTCAGMKFGVRANPLLRFDVVQIHIHNIYIIIHK